MIKYLLSSILILFQISTSFSQTFKISEASPSMSVDFKAGNLVDIKAGITNLTNKDITIVYKLLSKNIPASWLFAICDPIKCNNPGVGSESGDAILKADNKEHSFDAKIMAKEAGFAELIYTVFDKADEKNATTVKFTFNALPLGVGLNGNAVSYVKTFPNPVLDNLNISFESNSTISDLVIKNIAGIDVYNQPILSKSGILSIPMSNFGMGIYFISLRNNNKEILQSIKINKL